MSMKLTEDLIEKLVCPLGQRDRLVFDTKQGGLAVRVTSGGAKSYLVQYNTVDGKRRRLPLDKVSRISLDSARRAALATLGQVVMGLDPATERSAARKATKATILRKRATVQHLIEEWEARHLCDCSANYRKEAPRLLKRALTAWLDKPAEDLTREHLATILKPCSRSIARSIKAYGSACFGWSIADGAIRANPFKELATRLATTERGRVLDDAEMSRVWIAAGEIPSAYGPIVRVLLLTAQRRQEVAGMRWDELSKDLMVWTIPGARTKNGELTVVPLSAAVRKIILAMPRTSGELVFAGEDGKPFGNWSKSKIVLNAASGVTSWWLHDLRRTASTGFQALGVPFEVNEAILNHVSGSRGGVAGIYQRHKWTAEKALALEAWSEHVLEISARESRGTVVLLACDGPQQ